MAAAEASDEVDVRILRTIADTATPHGDRWGLVLNGNNTMMYDAYGYREASLGDQLSELSKALGVEWVLHESDYRGGYFAARAPTGTGKLRLQSNDLRDGDYEYREPDFPEYRYLLFVVNFDGPDEVRTMVASLPQWRFLYRSIVD